MYSLVAASVGKQITQCPAETHISVYTHNQKTVCWSDNSITGEQREAVQEMVNKGSLETSTALLPFYYISFR